MYQAVWKLQYDFNVGEFKASDYILCGILVIVTKNSLYVINHFNFQIIFVVEFEEAKYFFIIVILVWIFFF